MQTYTGQVTEVHAIRLNLHALGVEIERVSFWPKSRGIRNAPRHMRTSSSKSNQRLNPIGVPVECMGSVLAIHATMTLLCSSGMENRNLKVRLQSILRSCCTHTYTHAEQQETVPSRESISDTLYCIVLVYAGTFNPELSIS